MRKAFPMALSYLAADRDQQFLLPPDMREWLGDDHLVWFVLEVVGRLDTAALHARHANDGAGRRAYDPDMLLALLVYSYCTGLRSSRQIERRCESDAAFRIVCANKVPDHTTIARFRQAHTREAAKLFTDVLVLCAEAGLAHVGVVAVDGTKMFANASTSANTTRAQIEGEVRSMMSQADSCDDAENRLFGSSRGDELPAELADPRSRGAHLDAALRQLERAEDARQAEEEAARAAWHERRDEAAAKGRRPSGKVPAAAQVAAAEAGVAMEDERTAQTQQQWAQKEAAAAARGRKLKGRRPVKVSAGQRRARKTLARAKRRAEERKLADQRARDGAKANTTDPDSRVMKSARDSWIQAYNSQAAVNEAGVVLAASVTQQTNDVCQCEPMVAAIAANLDVAGIEEEVDLLLFDAGYLSAANLTADGPDRLIATDKSRRLHETGRTTGDPPPGATPREAMEHRLKTPAGRSTYKLRGQLVEPYFGVVKSARGFERFMCRGLTNVDAEWKLIAATHNILKLFRQPLPAT
jgi:transposase